jgi:hypothetical protein
VLCDVLPQSLMCLHLWTSVQLGHPELNPIHRYFVGWTPSRRLLGCDDEQSASQRNLPPPNISQYHAVA